MKNFFKLVGIIAMVAVIGFGVVACDTDDNNNNNNGSDSYSYNATFSVGIGSWEGVSGGTNTQLNGYLTLLITVQLTDQQTLTEAQKNEIETAVKKLTKEHITVSNLTHTAYDKTRTLTIGEPVNGSALYTEYTNGWAYFDGDVHVGYRFTLNISRTASSIWNDSGSIMADPPTSTVTVNYPATEGFDWTLSGSNTFQW